MTLDELKACRTLVTEKQAAAALGISPRTLQKRRQKGQPPAYRKGDKGKKTGAVRYDPKVLLAWMPEVT